MTYNLESSEKLAKPTMMDVSAIIRQINDASGIMKALSNRFDPPCFGVETRHQTAAKYVVSRIVCDGLAALLKEHRDELLAELKTKIQDIE